MFLLGFLPFPYSLPLFPVSSGKMWFFYGIWAGVCQESVGGELGIKAKEERPRGPLGNHPAPVAQRPLCRAAVIA